MQRCHQCSRCVFLRLRQKGYYRTKYNGTSAVLYVISSGLTVVSPWLGTAAGLLAGKVAKESLYHQLGYVPHFDPVALRAKQEQLQSALSALDLNQQKYRIDLARASAYEETRATLTRRLDTDTRVFRYLTSSAETSARSRFRSWSRPISSVAS